uniref:Pleckstrin homology domain-containing family G member 4B n=2 Tax=Oryzias sinensis TaxID=183150 RepID=A0A8C7XWS1_9TELE
MGNTARKMNLDSVESSIQKLLSALYPPYEATAPTLLNQLFQTIDSRFQGDALRCFLDFLIPAKHILSTVQQGACAQYSDALFLCEGWPLCLRDQVVIHLAPIDPLLLQPGDFYLQVAPFCDQSARILVCNLLEEEGVNLDVVEETPVSETSYLSIFNPDFLCEINHGRCGTPLSQCLLTTEEGLVRLPWEQVAVPDFGDLPRRAGSSMASAPPTYPPPLPLPSSAPDFPEKSSPSKSIPLSTEKPLLVKRSSQNIQNSHPSALSLETRICPAKHGIAVSLCLVDSSSASSSQQLKVKESETVCKPIGWVSPNTWDSRFTGMTSSLSRNISASKNKNKGDSESTLKKTQTFTKAQNMSRNYPADHAIAEGEYIDALQASKLFGNDHLLTKEQANVESQPPIQTEAENQTYPFMQSQACNQLLQEESQSHLQLTGKSHSNHHSGDGGPPLTHTPSQAHLLTESYEPPQCVRTVRFAEKPCTPCMKRRQGGTFSRAQELRCRYRDSYQAALQNPVTFGKEKMENKLTVLEEDGDASLPNNGKQRSVVTETGYPCYNGQGTLCDPKRQDQPHPPSVIEGICRGSGEKNKIPYWKLGDTSKVSCKDYKATNNLHPLGPPSITKNEQLKDIEQSSKPHGSFQNVNGANTTMEAITDTKTTLSHKNISKHSDLPHNRYGSTFSFSEIPKMYEPHERLQSSSTDGRCSSLSTAVVDISAKCELVIVEGQTVRRNENTESCAEIPQLHVVKCKNSTAFGLVSPKITRKKIINPGSEQRSDSIGQQIENLSHSVRPPIVDIQTIVQRGPARPRPDHLPLETPDPSAHPLYQGVACLTGCKDRTGRAIVEFYGNHQGWNSSVTSHDLFQMLLYFHSITRKEVREAGLTLIFDAKKRHPPPQLYKALMDLQEWHPCVVNSLVLVADKDNALLPEKCPGIQTNVVTSIKALLKLVEIHFLSSNLDGTLSRSPCVWMEVHQRLFPFVNGLHEASNLLRRALHKLEEPQMTHTVQAVQQCIMNRKTLIRDVLEDSRLVSLQREGGAVLARLRKESDLKYPQCEDLSDAVDSVTCLYNYVEEQAHILVQKTNMTLEHLEYLLPLREIEGHLRQIQQWFNQEGERHLLEAKSVEESGDRMEQILNSFTSFLIEANDRRHHAAPLLSEAERLQKNGLSHPETEIFGTYVCTFKANLEDFLCRAEQCGRELQIMVNVCDFCEQATMLATECTDYLNQSRPRIHKKQDANRTSQVDHTSTQPLQQSQNSGVSMTDSCQPEIHANQNSDPISTNKSAPSTDSFILQAFQERFRHFSSESFQEVKAQASSLRSSRGMRVWNAAWLRCQEAQQQLQERMQEMDELYYQQAHFNRWCAGHFVDVECTNVQNEPPGGQSLVVQSSFGPERPQWEGVVSGCGDLKERRPTLCDSSPSSTAACCNIIIKPEENSRSKICQESQITPQSHHRSSRKKEKGTRRRELSRARSERDAAALSQSHVGCQWFPWGRRSVSQDLSNARVITADSSTSPEQRTPPPSSCSHHGQPSCRILVEAQKFQISRHGSFCSEDSCVSDQGALGGNRAVCCQNSSLPGQGCEGSFCLAKPHESSSSALRLQRVMEELVFTEREYARSLGYILTHYFPLMDRLDIPQDLRGKRGIIFGNLEKLYDFHNHYFLPELEACEREPAMIARCFLRHSESFGLYSLYSKNKPQSDALILHRRHDIFKKKQQELGDLMDLSSYLLRPIQRISKYSLLLQDILALSRSYRPKDRIEDAFSGSDECGPPAYVSDLRGSERERELAEIQAAADLVRFQMRHGNDLLTMDAIQDCDINLKEQGQLIRQDEFTVFFRKKKCIRRIFLFEDLILFTKPKKTDVGNDVYVYKQSFKTNDIGMTHNSSVGSLCFEIWFRRRKSEDTYTLKASSIEVKKAWTTDLESILWDQAAHSRELRLQERVFMGIGRKLYMDIQPSEAAICNRGYSCVLPGRIPVACCSHRALDHPRPHSVGSGSTASTTLSQSSSSSGRGSLPPAGCPGSMSKCADANPVVHSSPEVVTENQLNHLHQHNLPQHYKLMSSLVLNTTESSVEDTNSFSISDQSFLSAISGEVVDDSSLVSQSSQQQPSFYRTPSLRKNSSHEVVRQKPDLPPKPQHLAKAQMQVEEIIFGKTTEV